MSTLAPSVERHYRATRAKYPQYPARQALNDARAEEALQDAEEAGLIRFQVEPDYEPLAMPTDWGDEHGQRKYEQDMAAGRIAVYVVSAEVPKSCPHCSRALEDEWEIVASVGGVDVHISDESYVREVQRDLAREAGVIS